MRTQARSAGIEPDVSVDDGEVDLLGEPGERGPQVRQLALEELAGLVRGCRLVRTHDVLARRHLIGPRVEPDARGDDRGRAIVDVEADDHGRGATCIIRFCSLSWRSFGISALHCSRAFRSPGFVAVMHWTSEAGQ